jgi:hypothetical protein
MRATKVKAIRRAMRAEIEKGSWYSWIAHPSFYINVRGDRMLKFALQYKLQGGLKMVKLGKKIYRLSGVLPREQHGQNT